MIRQVLDVQEGVLIVDGDPVKELEIDIKCEIIVVLPYQVWFGNPLACGWLYDTLGEQVLDDIVYSGMVQGRPPLCGHLGRDSLASMYVVKEREKDCELCIA